jgi:hypothetical protein
MKWKTVLLLSRTAHAQSKRNVEGEELQHSSPNTQTIPSASHPQDVPARGRWTQYSRIAYYNFKHWSLSFSVCLVFMQYSHSSLSPLALYQSSISTVPPNSSLILALGPSAYYRTLFPNCTIKSLIFMHSEYSLLLLARVYFVHVFHQHAIDLCCCILHRVSVLYQ